MKQEDYLETLYNLEKTAGCLRTSDVAHTLKLRRPSVTQMMQRLAKDGYITYKPYFPISLTTKGRTIGRKVAERHAVLTTFLTLLGIPKRSQEKDIHGIEHHLSPLTLRRLKDVTAFLRRKGYTTEKGSSLSRRRTGKGVEKPLQPYA